MKRLLRIPTGPIVWISIVQVIWTFTLVLWILFFSERRNRLPDEGWGPLVWGIVLLALMMAGVVVIVVHFARQVAHNKAVKEFISQVSHDLRSPLATVKIHLETMRLRRLSADQRHACLAAALFELDRLEDSIEEILTANRLERRRFRVNAENVDLQGFLQAFVQRKQNHVAHCGATLTLGTLPAHHVWVDPLLLTKALDNLVDNALNHCQKGVAIRLTLNEQGRCAVISVIDDGPGLDRREWKRVFRMFYRTAKSRGYRKGTGLGLFIVAGIARAHGGNAWVECPERGCHFRLALPLRSKEAVPS